MSEPYYSIITWDLPPCPQPVPIKEHTFSRRLRISAVAFGAIALVLGIMISAKTPGLDHFNNTVGTVLCSSAIALIIAACSLRVVMRTRALMEEAFENEDAGALYALASAGHISSTLLEEYDDYILTEAVARDHRELFQWSLSQGMTPEISHIDLALKYKSYQVLPLILESVDTELDGYLADAFQRQESAAFALLCKSIPELDRKALFTDFYKQLVPGTIDWFYPHLGDILCFEKKLTYYECLYVMRNILFIDEAKIAVDLRLLEFFVSQEINPFVRISNWYAPIETWYRLEEDVVETIHRKLCDLHVLHQFSFDHSDQGSLHAFFNHDARHNCKSLIEKDLNGDTPLHVALENNSEVGYHYFLKYSPDRFATNADNLSAIEQAITRENEDFLHVFCRLGTQEEKNRALKIAIEHDKAKTLHFMLSEVQLTESEYSELINFTLSLQRFIGRNCFAVLAHAYSLSQRVEATSYRPGEEQEFWASRTFDPYCFVDEGVQYFSNLFIASEKGDLQTLHRFLDAGLDPNESIEGTRPLMCAVSGEQPDAVELLLERGARGEPEYYAKEVALSLACRSPGPKSDEMVLRLLRHGASPLRNVEDGTPLHLAIRARNLPALRVLLAHDARLANGACKDYLSPLMWVEDPEDEELYALLLDKGADLNYRSLTDGQTLLHLVAKKQGIAAEVKGAFFRRMIKRGARPDILDQRRLFFWQYLDPKDIEFFAKAGYDDLMAFMDLKRVARDFFADLPEDLKKALFAYLPENDIASARKVCKDWGQTLPQ